jgi:uncharacterized glyoxalase superfamily protein PhnB/uncharacterized protein YndB with AHSA1/START domain
MEAATNEKTAIVNRQIVSSRVIQAPRELVFSAFTDPAVLAQWWGPKGFTNTFETFDLRPGGQWKFIMHGPNGKEYPNLSEFVEIMEPERIVFNHIVDPLFQMTIGFEEVENGTCFSFQMLFETEEEYEKVKAYVPQANEQNFDRLEAVLQKINKQNQQYMTQISPYLNFNGNCREAMNFYKETFGGSLSLMPVKETPMAAQCPTGMQDQIMHSSLNNGSFMLMASDMIMGGNYQPGNNFSLTVNCSSEEQTHLLFDKLAEGGQVFQPLQKQFWGALFGMVTDKFGTRWMLNYDQPAQAQ